MAIRKKLFQPLIVFLVTASILLGFSVQSLGERRYRSISKGHVNKGWLINAKKLPFSGRGFYSNPMRPNETAVYGTDEVIAALVKVGAVLHKKAPGAPLFINDIGFKEGGRIPQHGSHQAGRDADLLFFAFDDQGKVARPLCIPFDRDGKAVWKKGTPNNERDDQVRIFDTKRNWLVVRALIENQDALIQRIYVSEDIRTILLTHATKNNEPSWIIERAGDVMCEPRSPHDDHFHLRFFCTAEDYRQGCRDAWPLYPWRRTELALLGITDPKLRVMRPRKRPRRKKAKNVVKRKTPGRFWCP